MKFFTLLLLLFLSTTLVQAQEKIEREYRIEVITVPQMARTFVAKFTDTPTIKWLKEIGEEGISIEAKFKSDGARYSIEFSENGVLEDVEKNIGFSEMEERVKERIQQYLQISFDYYKVEKIQAQYTDPPEEILKWRKANEPEVMLKPRYELIVKSRNLGATSERFEFLFENDGSYLKKVKVSTRSDNILRY